MVNIGEWSVILRPEGVNGEPRGQNRSGLGIYLQRWFIDADGDQDVDEHEVTRVLFTRRRSRNPDTPFEEQLAVELAKAAEAAGVLNRYQREYEEARERVREESLAAARKEVREILGARPTKAA